MTSTDLNLHDLATELSNRRTVSQFYHESDENGFSRDQIALSINLQSNLQSTVLSELLEAS